jgi:hypothetical protein
MFYNSPNPPFNVGMPMRRPDRFCSRLWSCPALLWLAGLISCACAVAAPSVELGQRRELFVDRWLVDSARGVQFVLHEPRDEGVVVPFDAPWEGPFSAYCTILRDGQQFRAYYRGKPSALRDGVGEVTCVAESRDGIHWTKPKLGLIEVEGSRENNVVLASPECSHNLSPMLDENPAATPEQRYKAIGGSIKSGLIAFASPDGLRWKKIRDQPVLTKSHFSFPSGFDSQNLAFWSTTEKRYLMFFRVFENKIRRICRAESVDFINWTKLQLMNYRGADGQPTVIEHLYTSQTHPYFRAPHIYVALAARFMPGRQVINEEEAKAIQVHPGYFKDTSDAIFMTSRGGDIYDRTFLTAFVRPGIGAQNWVSRTTYPALNVVQTSPTEMSLYVNQDYAQPTAHLRRYSLRLDGFASVRAPYEGGELVTKPLTFDGRRLSLNFSTSAAGAVRVELQNVEGQPLPGFGLEQCGEMIGNEIQRAVRWNGNQEISGVAGKTVRLRFVMKDADLYAFHFGP